MKKIIYKNIIKVEEVAMEEVVKDFFDGDWDPKDWEETETDIDLYIKYELKEICDKEEDSLRAEIKKEFDKRVSIYRQEEIKQLEDRESILNFIDYYIRADYKNVGEVGYMLSNEEILDLIIENGRK